MSESRFHAKPGSQERFYSSVGTGATYEIKASWLLQGPQSVETLDSNWSGLPEVFASDDDIVKVIIVRHVNDQDSVAIVERVPS